MLFIRLLARCVDQPRSVAATFCAAVLVSVACLPNVALAGPIAHAPNRSKSCGPRPGESSTAVRTWLRRADQRRRATIARYRAEIVRLRRARASGHRGVIERDRRAIAGLRDHPPCGSHRVRATPRQPQGPPEPNRTKIRSDADQEVFQQWIDAASRAGISTPIGSVQVVNARCPVAVASSCTSVNEPIYLDPAEPDRADAFYHELGHQLWYRMGSAQRDEFMAIIGRAGQPYRQEGGNSPHEQWAEAYRVVVDVSVYGPTADRGAAYGLVVDQRRLAALTALMKNIRQSTVPAE